MNARTAFPYPLQDQALWRQQAYIDGLWCEADSGGELEVRNPANNELLGRVPNMGAKETAKAIAAADAAWPAWRSRTAKERAAILREWHRLMLVHQADLALLMTAEQGKPLA